MCKIKISCLENPKRCLPPCSVLLNMPRTCIYSIACRAVGRIVLLKGSLGKGEVIKQLRNIQVMEYQKLKLVKILEDYGL